MRLLAIVAIAFLLPVASAQNASTDELPVGTGAPGPEESLSPAWGFPFGAFVVLITLGLAGALAWASWRQRRNPPRDLP